MEIIIEFSNFEAANKAKQQTKIQREWQTERDGTITAVRGSQFDNFANLPCFCTLPRSPQAGQSIFHNYLDSASLFVYILGYFRQIHGHLARLLFVPHIPRRRPIKAAFCTSNCFGLFLHSLVSTWHFLVWKFSVICNYFSLLRVFCSGFSCETPRRQRPVGLLETKYAIRMHLTDFLTLRGSSTADERVRHKIPNVKIGTYTDTFYRFCKMFYISVVWSL